MRGQVISTPYGAGKGWSTKEEEGQAGTLSHGWYYKFRITILEPYAVTEDASSATNLTTAARFPPCHNRSSSFYTSNRSANSDVPASACRFASAALYCNPSLTFCGPVIACLDLDSFDCIVKPKTPSSAFDSLTGLTKFCERCVNTHPLALK